MWKDARFIASKDLRYMLREKQSLFWLFVMPIVFFYFIGTVTSGFGTPDTGTARPSLTVELADDAGFLGEALLGLLGERGYTVRRADESPRGPRLLRIPPGFTDRLMNMQPVTLHFIRTQGGLGQQIDTVRIQRAAYTLLADLIVIQATGMPAETASLEDLHRRPRAVTLIVEEGGERVRIPTGFEQAVPGIMVMFTLVVLLSSGAVLLVVERKQGLLRRLASAPITKNSVILGKWLSRMGIGVIQVAFGAAAGTLLFGVDWGPYWPWVVFILFLWSGLCASLALLLGSLARTEGQAVGIGVLSANLLAALGGCWWPIEIAPQWMQMLAGFLPTGWTMRALHQLVSFQQVGETTWVQGCLLAAAALLAAFAAVRRFRYQ